ncbi:hypothetical protein HK101_001414, partial [Irineochytrium annulatum]
VNVRLGHGMSQRALDRSGIKEPLETWEEGTVSTLVDAFLDERRPVTEMDLVQALNKIDLPDWDKNIERICRKYDNSKIVLTSAASEIFLRKLQKQGFVRYYEGTDRFDLQEHLVSFTRVLLFINSHVSCSNPTIPAPSNLFRPASPRNSENSRTSTSSGNGPTGTQSAFKLCVEIMGLIATYPVRNITHFGDGVGGKPGVFRDCLLVRRGSK